MLTKIFVFLFVFAIVFLLREIFEFVSALFNEDKAANYEVTTPRLWGIGVSLAYIIMTLFTGFSL